MKKYKLQILIVILWVYLIYALALGVIPNLREKRVPQSYKETVNPSSFYSETPSCDRVALVETPQDGFKTRLKIIDEAEERLDISYYAMHMGETTDIFLGSILDAAERGVKVRILVDGQFGGLTKFNKLYSDAIGSHENIELRVYNTPNILKPWTWNGCLHDKYIIVDDVILLLGGRNIGDKYFAPESFSGELSYDRDVLIYNAQRSSRSALFSVRDYMDSIWNDGKNVETVGKHSKKAKAKQDSLLESYRDYKENNASLFNHDDDWKEWTNEANKVTFIHNDAHINLKVPKVEYTLGALLLSAKESAVMQSPYVINSPQLRRILKELGEKDIDARILTNSPGSSPNPIALSAYYGCRKSILKKDIRIFEYQGSGSIHAKSYQVDNRLTLIGSYNLDPRSASLDTELLLAIDSTEFAAHFNEVQASYFDKSLELSADGSYVENAGVAVRNVSLSKWMMIYLLYLPIKLVLPLS